MPRKRLRQGQTRWWAIIPLRGNGEVKRAFITARRGRWVCIDGKWWSEAYIRQNTASTYRVARAQIREYLAWCKARFGCSEPERDYFNIWVPAITEF